MKKHDIISLLIIVIFAGLLAILLVSCTSTWVWVRESDDVSIGVDNLVDSVNVGHSFRTRSRKTAAPLDTVVVKRIDTLKTP